ncbi:MAG: ABC transporter permease [Trueperaceae bacterium]|nr:ABC transporter permease [Trueperaceae bacterium]
MAAPPDAGPPRIDTAPPPSRRTSRRGRLVASLRSNPVALVSLIVMVAILVAAVAAPYLAPYDPAAQSLRLRLRPPAWLPGGEPGYLLGTDALGRDMLTRILYGARVSILVGVLAVAIQTLIGVGVGLIAGFYGGAIDNVFMRIADVQQAIPFLVLVVAVAAVLGPSFVNTVLILGVTGWVTYGRVVRAQVLSLVQQEYVTASRALGGRDWRIMLLHLLPNLVAPITVVATLTISAMILIEASLSFLGLGVPPPTPTWGGMVADGRNYLVTAWWVSVFPGCAIFVTVLVINLVGDWLREALDPTLRRG